MIWTVSLYLCVFTLSLARNVDTVTVGVDSRPPRLVCFPLLLHRSSSTKYVASKWTLHNKRCTTINKASRSSPRSPNNFLRSPRRFSSHPLLRHLTLLLLHLPQISELTPIGS